MLLGKIHESQPYIYISVVTELKTENPRSEMHESGLNPNWSEYRDVFFPQKIDTMEEMDIKAK